MSDSEDKQESPAIPNWQRGAQSEQSPAPATAPQDDKLEVARRFLDDEAVKDASREKKVEFLKSKDIADEEIRSLVGEEEGAAAVVHGDGPEEPQQQADNPAPLEASRALESSEELREITPTIPSVPAAPTPAAPPSPTASSPPPETTSLLHGSDRPPIVTYPEFLAKPIRPPPLVTKTALFNTLYSFAGLSTLVYGCSKYILAPMVESQTEARQDFHTTTAAKLDSIVAKLESTVSEIPPRKSMTIADDAASEAEDPTEMFHRDMGTQTTSPLATPPIKDGKEPAVTKEAGKLESISKKLTDLRNEVRAQSEDMEDIKTLVDTFRDELDSMTYPGQGEYLAGYDIYGRTRKQDPDDEVKKVRDNIRRVKGVLLSTRNFPASTR